jgi:two-component system sensor histidine kinase CreC
VIQIEELERTLQQLGKRALNARIFNVDKTRVDLHVYVTDANGVVLFDSSGRDVGKDYRAWRDVGRTLAGQYGARTTLADPADPASAVMYVGAAIRERPRRRPDEIVGMVKWANRSPRSRLSLPRTREAGDLRCDLGRRLALLR